MDVAEVVQVLMQQRDRLFAYLWTMVRDVQLAEDALQELSLLAVKKGIEARDEEGLWLWLREAARLKALEALHKRSKLPVTLSDRTLDQLDACWPPLSVADENTKVEALRRCISELTPHSREILTMRYVDGKKSAEIANALGRKAETIYKAIARLHTTLRRCVEMKLAEASE